MSGFNFGRSVTACFLDDVENTSADTLKYLDIDMRSIELAAPGAITGLSIVVTATSKSDDPFQALRLILDSDNETINEILYLGTAVWPREQDDRQETYEIDHVFEIPDYMLYRERKYRLRALTERGPLETILFDISFPLPF